MKARNTYVWLRWIIEDNLPFSFVEKVRTRENTKLDPISRSSVMKYLRLVTNKVEQKVKDLLPQRFGLIIDGWSSNTMHFCVLFACLPDLDIKLGRPMLAFSPLLDETSQSAQAHLDWIKSSLRLYGMDFRNIMFLVSDNTNCMPALARLMHTKFIGCASHKLALYVKLFLDIPLIDDEERPLHVLNKVKKLMKKLRSCSKAGALRLETSLKPVINNATRWSSTFCMIARYISIERFLDRTDRDIIHLLLTAPEHEEVRMLEVHLKQINDVTVLLQGDAITLSTARVLLDGIVSLNLPGADPNQHITANAAIVRFPDFESGIIKLLNDQASELSAEEAEEVSVFIKMDVDHQDQQYEESGNYAIALLNRNKRRKKEASKYVDLSFIPATSVLCEREFSQSSLVYSELRQSMTPLHLECVLYLKHNHLLWDALLVQEVINISP